MHFRNDKSCHSQVKSILQTVRTLKRDTLSVALIYVHWSIAGSDARKTHYCFQPVLRNSNSQNLKIVIFKSNLEVIKTLDPVRRYWFLVLKQHVFKLFD